MPSTGMPALLPSSPTSRPAWVPALPGRGYQAVDAQPHLIGLVHQFLRAGDIAQRADPVGAATRNHIRLLAGRTQSFALRLRRGVHVCAARAVLDRGVEQPVEQHVAAVQIVAVVGVDPVLQQRRALHAEPPRHRRGLAHVIGLDGALGHQMVGAQCLSLAYQPLQLAHLVAAGRHHGAVVALDPDFGAAEVAAEIGQLFERCGGGEQPYTGETGEVHEISCQRRGPDVMFPILTCRTMRLGGAVTPW